MAANLLKSRQAKYGAYAGAYILVILAVLGALNFLANRYSKSYDSTSNKQFSLSDQTKNVVAKLDAPMQITVFAQEPEFQRYHDKLNEYQYSSKQVTTDYVDPDKKPAIAKQNQIQQYGTIVINYKGRTERVTSDNEQDVTNAIIKVVSGQQRKVYFTQGHGEKDKDGSEREGYNAIAGAMGRENYALEKLVLAQQGAVPDDASVVIVAGPKIDFFPNEIEALKKYLDKQGKLLLLIDRRTRPTRRRSPTSSRSRTTGASRSATTWSWTSAGWAVSSGPTHRCRSSPAIRRIPSRRTGNSVS